MSNNKYTDEYIINITKAFFINKQTPTRKTFQKFCLDNNFFCGDTIHRRFSSYDNLARLAGVEFQKPVTKEDIIIVSKKIFKDFPNIERNDFYRKIKLYKISRKLILNRFKNINNLAKECNYQFKRQLKPNVKKLRQEEIINIVKDKLKGYSYTSVFELKQFAKQWQMPYHSTILKKLGKENFERYTGIKLINNKELKTIRILEALKKEFTEKEVYKSDINNFLKQYKISLDEIARRVKGINKAINYIGYNYLKRPRKWKPGKNEEKILSLIEEKKQIELKRQYYVKGYFIDGYDPLNNIAYEVDEPHHKFRKDYDMKREQKIRSILNCNFIRINDNSGEFKLPF